MKKFIVIHTRESLFRKNAVSTFEETFTHAVDAWKAYKALSGQNARDGRWPILSLEIRFQ